MSKNQKLKKLDLFEGNGFLTFIVESVYSVDASTLMISSQQKEVFWIFNFVC